MKLRKNMIAEVYDFLKSKHIVSSQSEFSENWLSYSECYMRTLKMKDSEPSMGAIAICASRLLNAADQLGSLPRYHALSQQLRQLGNRCREVVDADSVEFELAA
jgi:hypothetical protein